MINTAIGGMKTRFLQRGKNPTLLILASSKRSEKSFLEVHMKKKLAAEKENVLIVDEPVWNVKPPENYSGKKFNVALGNKFLLSQVIPDNDDINLWKDKGYKVIEVPVEFKPEFIEDIDRALCDFAGISSSEISKYISGVAVQEIINQTSHNPFIKDIIEVGNGPDDKAQYYDFFNLNNVPPSMKSKPLFIHLDMSVSGDKTGIAGVWIKGKKTSVDELSQANDLLYSVAFSVAIKAPKGRQVSFEKNRNFIYWLKEQGFRIKGVTSDSFQSVDFGQALLAKGYPYEQLSVDRVDPSSHICKPYQYFKSAIYEKRIEVYRSQHLIDQITDLERNINTGKVDHPDGGEKDTCDAVCGAIFNASKHAEEFAYDYGEDLSITTTINNSTSFENNKQQINLLFEQEMQKAFDPRIRNQQPQDQTKKENDNPPQQTQFMDFGLGAAKPLSGAQYLKDGIIIW